jgi:HEAT repeat protein
MDNQMTLDELLASLKSADPNVRAEAWTRAGQVGSSALEPLAEIMATGELEVGRVAQCAMWKITRAASAPNALGRRDTITALTRLLDQSHPVPVRREVMWMLSEIAEGDAVKPIAALLHHEDLREDCRMVLERIPGRRSLEALKIGFDAAPEPFKYHLAQSLRARGVEVDGYPCQKLVPKKETRVKTL